MIEKKEKTTTTMTPLNTMRLLIIEKLNDALISIEYADIKRNYRSSLPRNTAYARVKSLFLLTNSLMKRKLSKEQYETLRNKLNQDRMRKGVNLDYCIDAFQIIEGVLSAINLTRVDYEMKQELKELK